MSVQSHARWFVQGHTCVAHHCVAMISQNWLFCGQHWSLVPDYLKNAIHAHYQAKRRLEFVAAVDVAIAEVAKAGAA